MRQIGLQSSPASADAPMAGAEQRGLAARRCAWQVLQAVAAGAYADGALERELGRANLSPQDRALASCPPSDSPPSCAGSCIWASISCSTAGASPPRRR
jgi:hypothetical protein